MNRGDQDFRLGDNYQYGRGVKRDYVRAREYYERSNR